jgi:hypothetical protein
MRKFHLPPKPIAILSLVALLAVPLTWLALLPDLGAISCLQTMASDEPGHELNFLQQLGTRIRSTRYTPEQRLILGLDENFHGHNYLDGLVAAKPDSLVIQTRWTLSKLTSHETPLAEKLTLLEKMEKADPENSLWPVQRAHCLMDASAKLDYPELPPNAPKKTPAPLQLTVSNQAQFDQGIAELRRALAMPKYDNRLQTLVGMQVEAFGPVQNLYDTISLISVLAANQLSELTSIRSTTRFAVLYGERLLQQGKIETARPLLRAWLPLAERQLCSNDNTLIAALVAGACINMGQHEENAWRAAGKTAEAEQAAALWKSAYQPIETFRKANKENREQAKKFEEFAQRGGILSAMLLPALGNVELPPLEEAFAWRQLEYLQFLEQGTYGSAMILLWLGLVIGLLIHGFAKPQNTAENGQEASTSSACGWLDLCRPVAWILLPLAVYRLFERGFYVRETCLPGHFVAAHYIVGLVLLLLTLILAFALPKFCCRTWRELPGRWLLIPAVLILTYAAMAMVAAHIEAPQLVRQAKFMQVSAEGFTQIEADVAKKLKAEMRARLNKE